MQLKIKPLRQRIADCIAEGPTTGNAITPRQLVQARAIGHNVHLFAEDEARKIFGFSLVELNTRAADLLIEFLSSQGKQG